MFICLHHITQNTDQQLKEEPGVFVSVLSADSSADDHLQGQLLVKLLHERKKTQTVVRNSFTLEANGIKYVLLNRAFASININ